MHRVIRKSVGQHPSRSKYCIYQTFLDYCLHLLLANSVGSFLGIVAIILKKRLSDFSRRDQDGIKKTPCMIIFPLSLF